MSEKKNQPRGKYQKRTPKSLTKRARFSCSVSEDDLNQIKVIARQKRLTVSRLIAESVLHPDGSEAIMGEYKLVKDLVSTQVNERILIFFQEYLKLMGPGTWEEFVRAFKASEDRKKQ